jgi:hypothetical protein
MDVVGQGWFCHWVPPFDCHLKEYPIGRLRQVVGHILFMHTPHLYISLVWAEILPEGEKLVLF